MRACISILALLVAAATVHADHNKPRPFQAPTRCVDDCKPAQTAMLATHDHNTLPPLKVSMRTSYDEASVEAARLGKPLGIWVAYKCPSTANQMPGMVHVFLDSFQGSSQQRVVVAVPDGKGWLNLAGTVSAPDCCANNLQRTIDRSSGAGEEQWGSSSLGQMKSRSRSVVRSSQACAT